MLCAYTLVPFAFFAGAPASAPQAAVAFNAKLLSARPPARTSLRMSDAPASDVDSPADAEVAATPAVPAEVTYSEALPMLVKRKQLAGYPGDVGFDPIGFSEILPMDWLREAELKHCRVCMLAVVGFAFTDFYHLPGFDYTTLEAHDACVASGAMSQLLLWLGLLELASLTGIDQMLRGSGRSPGDYGFDPVGFGVDGEKMRALQEKELANGRLAMFGFSGIVTQAVLTGNTFPYLFGNAETWGSFGDAQLSLVPLEWIP